MSLDSTTVPRRGLTQSRNSTFSAVISLDFQTVLAEAEYGKIVKLKGSTTVEFMDVESE